MTHSGSEWVKVDQGGSQWVHSGFAVARSGVAVARNCVEVDSSGSQGVEVARSGSQ